MRKDLKKTVKACKMTWLNYIMKHVADAHMLNANGGDVWKAIEEIVAGINGYHKQLTLSKPKDKLGKVVENNKETADIFGGFFIEVFNHNNMPVSIERMMSYIQQRERVSEADAELSRKDVLEAIFGCPNGKGTGESRIPVNAIKAISEDAKDAIADAIIRFWHGEIDVEQLAT